MSGRHSLARGVLVAVGVLAVVLASGPQGAQAVLRMHPLFGDNMVIQSNNINTQLIGVADPNATVVATSPKGNVSAVADETGAFKLFFLWLPVQDRAPFNITVTSLKTGEQQTARNVLAGDVLMCSGQSNAEVPVSYIYNASAQIADAVNWPNVRLVHVAPDGSLSGWEVASPATVPAWSAFCYLSAVYMLRQHCSGGDGASNDACPDVAALGVGVISAAQGATPMEVWMPPAAVASAGCRAVPFNHSTHNPPWVTSQNWARMIQPLSDFPVRAFLWYQGEDNALPDDFLVRTRGQFGACFRAMIHFWRAEWMARSGQGPSSFVFVQLAAWDAGKTGRLPGNVSSVRLGQADAETRPLADPGAAWVAGDGVDAAAMVVTIDLGSRGIPTLVHPKNKTEVARRTGLVMHRVTYAHYRNDSQTPAFPRISVVRRAGPGVVAVTFSAGGGLHLWPTHNCTVCCGKEAVLFEAGAQNTTVEGGGWVAVQNFSISTTGGEVVLHGGAALDQAKYLRFLIADYPECVLHNEFDLPAGPFLVEIGEEKSGGERWGAVERGGERVDAGKAAGPPLGWNTWNRYHADIDENLVRATADAFVERGLAEAGYRYVNLDDGWAVYRNATTGEIVPDPARFPTGMRALGEYLHNRSLLFGIYTAAHGLTCQRRPGSYGFEAQDVATYCEWGVDYIKVDQCAGAAYAQQNTSWIKFRAAIDACTRATGRPIFLSVESCGEVAGCGQWVGGLANSWRTSADVQPLWASVMNNYDVTVEMYPVSGGGGCGGLGRWNDADMLQVGNAGLTETEAKSHFTLWAAMNSPLLLGTDVQEMTAEVEQIVLNKEVIGLGQDSLGYQARRVGPRNATGSEVLQKRLSGGRAAFVLLNRNDAEAVRVRAEFADGGLDPGTAYVVYDLWEKQVVGRAVTGGFEAVVEPHGVVAVRVGLE